MSYSFSDSSSLPDFEDSFDSIVRLDSSFKSFVLSPPPPGKLKTFLLTLSSRMPGCCVMFYGASFSSPADLFF